MKQVYIIAADGHGMYKIGIARNAQLRLAELQTGSPVLLRVVEAVQHEDPLWLEAALHEQFAAHRAHGEWFVFDENTLALAINALHNPPPYPAPPVDDDEGKEDGDDPEDPEEWIWQEELSGEEAAAQIDKLVASMTTMELSSDPGWAIAEMHPVLLACQRVAEQHRGDPAVDAAWHNALMAVQTIARRLTGR